jgi:hypothetical protein
LSAEARRPLERDAEETDRRAASVPSEVLGDAQSVVGGFQAVIGLQSRQVADEVQVAAALDVDEGPHEGVVGVEAAGENQREYVHSGVTTVRVSRRTGPK